MSLKYQLKNGLNVILQESHKSPVVSIQMWVKTGSADENKGREGVSHFIEHLLFKGTEKYKPGEIAYSIEAAGGEINAYTSFDQTVFYVTISSGFVDTGLSVISEMMGRPTFDSEEIDKEREVVIEEIKRSLDNPRQLSSRLLFANNYTKHPYGIPVIGYEQNIKKLSRKEILKYYNSRYTPQNMNLLIVGDFDTKIMKKKVDEYFSNFKRHKLNKIKRKSEPVKRSLQLKVQPSEFHESLLHIAWSGVHAKAKDNPALSILTIILGQGESSRIYKAAHNRERLVNSIGMSHFAPSDPGIIAVSAGLPEASLAPTLNCVMGELEQILTEVCSQEELEKAKNNIESEKLYSIETVDGQASLLGQFEMVYRDRNYFEKLLRELRAIQPLDIMKVARKYLNPKKIALSYLTNGDTKKAEQELKDWHNKYQDIYQKCLKIKPIKSKGNKKTGSFKNWKLPKVANSMPARLTVLESGARVLTKKIKGSPVISVRGGYLGGLRAEKERTRGTTELLSRAWASGSTSTPEEIFHQKVDNMAASISAFGGRNTMGLSMVSLVPYFNNVYNLFEEVMSSPELSAATIEREKKSMAESIQSRNDKPAQICMLNLNATMFGNHPYGLDMYPELDKLEQLDRDRMIELMANSVSSQNLVISAAGDIDEVDFINRVSEFSNTLHKTNEMAKTPKPEAILKNQHTFVEQKKEQSHFAMAYRGVTFNDSRRFALEVMQSILSGQGGRLFLELRDKASLAYTVMPIRMDGIDTGYFGAYIGCSPEKVDKAQSMMKIEFNKLMQELVTQEELSRAKKYLVGRHDISLQRTSVVADHLYFDTTYGLGYNEVENLKDKLESVTAQDIQLLAQSIFTQPTVTSVVGKKDLAL